MIKLTFVDKATFDVTEIEMRYDATMADYKRFIQGVVKSEDMNGRCFDVSLESETIGDLVLYYFSNANK